MAPSNPVTDQLIDINLAIERLALVCELSVLDMHALEAVLAGDPQVCGRGDPVAWLKLRGLLVLHLHVLTRSVVGEGMLATSRAMRVASDAVSLRMGHAGASRRERRGLLGPGSR